MIHLEYTLVDFILLNIGTTASTEWEGELAIELLRKYKKKNPELKKCIQGLIHSHHSMGAYFSSTDKGEMEETASANHFVPSLVVSSSDSAFAFAICYKDQFNIPHFIEATKNEIFIEYHEEIREEWKEEYDRANKERKEKESKAIIGYQNYGNNYQNNNRELFPYEYNNAYSTHLNLETQAYTQLEDDWMCDTLEWDEYSKIKRKMTKHTTLEEYYRLREEVIKMPIPYDEDPFLMLERDYGNNEFNKAEYDQLAQQIDYFTTKEQYEYLKGIIKGNE